MAELSDNLIKKYQNLPEDLRRILFSADVEQKILNIARKHNLHIDQLGILEELIDQTIIGVMSVKDFAKQFEFLADINQEQTRKITQDIDAEIFRPIRESLMKLAETQKEELAHPDLAKPHPSKEEILEAISNPEQVALIKKERGPVVGAEVTPPAEGEKTLLLPISATVEMPKIHQEKLSDIVRVAKKETGIAPAINRRPIIPEDIKNRLNKDPYREPI